MTDDQKVNDVQQPTLKGPLPSQIREKTLAESIPGGLDKVSAPQGRTINEAAAATKEEKVLMEFPRNVILTLKDHSTVFFPKGLCNVPKSMSTHEYLARNGATISTRKDVKNPQMRMNAINLLVASGYPQAAAVDAVDREGAERVLSGAIPAFVDNTMPAVTEEHAEYLRAYGNKIASLQDAAKVIGDMPQVEREGFFEHFAQNGKAEIAAWQATQKANADALAKQEADNKAANEKAIADKQAADKKAADDAKAAQDKADADKAKADADAAKAAEDKPKPEDKPKNGNGKPANGK